MKKVILVSAMALTTMIIISTACCTGKNISTSLENKSDVYKILYYASLAGSSHNSQPWKAEVFPGDSILVFADTSRLLTIIDPRGIELCISLGAFIENLDVAANALGYKTKVTLCDTVMNASTPVAGIQLTKTGSAQNMKALEELELRTTLRIPFDTMAIKKSDRERLASIDPEKIIFISSCSPDGIFLAKKELEAYSVQAYQKDAQDELATWMRFSDRDVNSKRDGLTPAGMAINGIAGFMVRNFMKPEDSKKTSFVKAGVEKTQIQVENCGGWILISTKNDGLSEWINVGRIYERVNIQCRSLGLGFHPMNQVIEVPYVFREVNNKLASGGTIRFVARIGYVKEYPAPVSKRRHVESFTIFR